MNDDKEGDSPIVDYDLGLELAPKPKFKASKFTPPLMTRLFRAVARALKTARAIIKPSGDNRNGEIRVTIRRRTGKIR